MRICAARRDVDIRVHKWCVTKRLKIWNGCIGKVSSTYKQVTGNLETESRVTGVAEIPKQEISNSETIGFSVTGTKVNVRVKLGGFFFITHRSFSEDGFFRISAIPPSPLATADRPTFAGG